MLNPQIYKIEQISELSPPFDSENNRGWIGMIELNIVIDPMGDNYSIEKEALFENGEVFVLIDKIKNEVCY